MILLAVDPGVQHCGLALFEDDLLISAGLATHGARIDHPWHCMADAAAAWCGRELGSMSAVTDLALEFQQIYQSQISNINENDLLDCAAVCGAIGKTFHWARRQVFLPTQWKGQVKKEIHQTRIEGTLSADERKQVLLPGDKSLRHNVWDAIGLGLFALKRHARGGEQRR